MQWFINYTHIQKKEHVTCHQQIYGILYNWHNYIIWNAMHNRILACLRE